ncbi:hypothetical protein KIH87_02390 [Paraneptunicella aestuarii]|nr:hypothetical protein [Paraneptunicella aestuarii]UAA39233.1 hypothetical protein KIH87_02390 [Paraneptunicella aestuarii]
MKYTERPLGLNEGLSMSEETKKLVARMAAMYSAKKKAQEGMKPKNG